MIEVIILKGRIGPGVSYKRGSRQMLPKGKAAFAVAQGWAKYTEKEPVKPKPEIQTATSKTAEKRTTRRKYTRRKKTEK